MNKYLGFYQLKALGLPAVPWRQFSEQTELDDRLLWTVRVAVIDSNDLNLPRFVGVGSMEAVAKGRELLDKYCGRGLVIYYPYFIAEKSGVLDISSSRTVIEAVDGDLWNLVTYGRKAVTIISANGLNSLDTTEFHGDSGFLSQAEIDEIRKYSALFRGRFREDLSEGKSVFAEWSFAYNTDVGKKPIGDRYLVFYELRTVK